MPMPRHSARARPIGCWSRIRSTWRLESRGRGVGKALLGRTHLRCTQLGFRQMVAVIGGAHPASVAVHRAVGLKHGGLLKATGFKHGRWLDTMIMQLPLGEGNDERSGTRQSIRIRCTAADIRSFSTSFSILSKTFSTCCRSWPRFRIVPCVLIDAVGALFGCQFRVFLDPEQRHLSRPLEYGEDRPVASDGPSRSLATRLRRPCGHRPRGSGRVPCGGR